MEPTKAQIDAAYLAMSTRYTNEDRRDLAIRILRAALNAPGETDQQMYDRIYGDPPIDGTGWAEAAFVDDVDPAQRSYYGPQYYVRAGQAVSPFRGQGE